MLSTGLDISHYSKLYSYKYFRNRVIRLQTLCSKQGLDAIVLINGKLPSILSVLLLTLC
jgi:hypothetical protein